MGVQGVQVHHQNFWFVKNVSKIPQNPGKIPQNLGKIPENPNKTSKYLGKISENLGKNGPQRSSTSKNGAQRLQKNKWRPCLDIAPQNGRQKLCDNLLGRFWKNLGKNLLHPQNFACSHTYEVDNTFFKKSLFNFIFS